MAVSAAKTGHKAIAVSSLNSIGELFRMKLRFTLQLFLALCCCLLSVVPAHADVLYNNGGGSQFLTMWDISGTNQLSNQFTCNYGACTTQYLEFDATFPGDYSAQHVNWSITSAPFGGTTFA